MRETISHYVNYSNDPFSFDASNSTEYVIGNIKPAYSLFLDGFDIADDMTEYIMAYIGTPQFQINYNNAKEVVEKYVEDLYSNSPLINITKAQLTIFVAKYNGETYVIKGEFILRVINDFILGKIKLAGKTHEQFKDKFYNEYTDEDDEGYKDHRIQFQETVLQLSKERPLSEYIYLLDRYEVYDEDFIEHLKGIAELFVF